MTEPSLEELEAQRRELIEKLAEVGDFRRGSVGYSYRRCGKANCACARTLGHPGHGRLMWTRTGPDGKTRGRLIKPAEEQKVRAELENYYRYANVSDQIVEVNEAICEARPPGASASAPPAALASESDGEKGGSASKSRRRSPPR